MQTSPIDSAPGWLSAWFEGTLRESPLHPPPLLKPHAAGTGPSYHRRVKSKLARFAWFVLGYNVLVIAWGAYVRATGSGAGCGAHWPLCNGEVIPRAPSTEMLVEFSHRVTSGLALVAVVALLVWTFRACEKGHPARRGAVLSMTFMLTEAALGAGLVLFRLVAGDPSVAHAVAMAAHLANTFLLLASLALTAHWAAGGADVSLALAGRGRLVGTLAAGLVGLLLVGKSGAIAAFGDMLAPARSLAEGVTADFSPATSLLMRLRVLHPALAMVVAGMLAFGVARVPLAFSTPTGRIASRAVAGLAAAEVCAGFLNLWLLAPVGMQLVHLVMADLLWIALVLLAASALATSQTKHELAERSGVCLP